MINIKNLTKNFSVGSQCFVVLKNLSLVVNSGDLLAIVGPSGSGKSTLMNIIGLLERSDSGIYTFNNNNVAKLTNDEAAILRNSSIGFVFQHFNLLPRYTVVQNVALPLTYKGLSHTLVRDTVMRALLRVNMQTFAEHKPIQLSGGQQQRVAIARALVNEPQVILADEPTGSLDSETGKQVMDLFLSLHKEGRTLILVTHDERIANQCTRKITLRDGQIIAQS
jgi:putative ABC transport system ATP-binding protein